MTEDTLTPAMMADITALKASGFRLSLYRAEDRWSLIANRAGAKQCYLFTDFTELGTILRKLID